MRNLLMVFSIVLGAQSARASTSPVDCFDVGGRKIMSLEVVSGPLIINGVLYPDTELTEIRYVMEGLVAAKAGRLNIAFLGQPERAVVLDSNGLVVSELSCRKGNRQRP